MLFIKHNNQTPAYNLALEEYLMRHRTEDFFILWRNSLAIVLGKHQNAMAEINPNYVHENQIPVLRRLSGGGTVFHDTGNFNFTFILNGQKGKMVDFKRYTAPIRHFLQSIGVPAEFSPRNDLFVGEKKISGNAEHLYKQRVLHHGTLLFSSNLKALSAGLHANKKAYTDKAVQSVRKPVANISDFLSQKISINEFQNQLFQYVLQSYPNASITELSAHEHQIVETIQHQKYNQWQWNFGYSPKYTFENQHQQLSVFLDVKDGLIQQLKLTGNTINDAEKKMVTNLLVNKAHHRTMLQQIIENSSFTNIFEQIHWTKLFF